MTIDLTETETQPGREREAAQGRARAKRKAALADAMSDAPRSSANVLDALAGERPTVMLEVALLEPHPDNPRRDVGDITELAFDIRMRGVDSPLTVVPTGEHPFTHRVVIGHRRRAAAIAVGVERVPCIVRAKLTRAEQRQMMVRENSHRADLTAVEEADAIQAMLDVDGLAVDDVAHAIARSETTVRRRMRLAGAPEPARIAIHNGQATLEEWDKALAAADGDADVLDALAAVMGTKDFAYRVTNAAREASERRALARGLEQLEAAGIPVVEDAATVGARRYVGQWPSQHGTGPSDLAEVPPGTFAVRPSYAGATVVWLYVAVEDPPPVPAAARHERPETEEAAAAEGSSSEWDDEGSLEEAQARHRVQQEEAAAAAAECETARALRLAFLEGLTSGSRRWDQAHLWVLTQIVAEIFAHAALEDDWVEVSPMDHPFGLNLDAAVERARTEASDLDEDPATVDELQVAFAAAPKRIEELGGPAALVLLVASAIEPRVSARAWQWGFQEDWRVRVYYRLLDALGYVPSSVEEAALNRPDPDGAQS